VRVAITGSNGLIGSALAESLERDRHEVVRVPRSSSGFDLSAIDSADAVVNLAGAGIGDKRWTRDRKRLVIESRTTNTRALSEHIAAAPIGRRPRVLLSGSAIGYYGDRGDEVLTEESQPGQLFLSEICVAWEAATAPATAAGARVAHLRTGIVLAPEGGALGKMLPLFKAGIGGRMGSGKQWWSWVALDDEVGAIRFLLENDVDGPVNLTGPEPVTNAQLTSALGKVLHRPTRLPVPKLGPAALLGRELAYELLYASQRVVPRVLEREGYQFRHGDVTSALHDVLRR
jgi:uncharacterized protein (TIGR01777 family)